MAMPQVMDPFFHRSVVLMIGHEEEGSFGFVVNRPTDLTVSKILEDLRIEWNGSPELPAFLGGPVQPQIGTVLFPTTSRPALQNPDDATEVAPGISITQNLSQLTKLASSPPAGMRLLLGYAGWTPGQLAAEVSRHDWLTAPVDEDLLFSIESQLMWETALQRIGIDPDNLPNWTETDQAAN